MIRIRLTLSLLVALVLAAGCGSGHKQARAQTDGTIVVNGSVGGEDGTYAVRPDGGGLARLDLGVSDDNEVYWNPAGTTALVVVYGDGLTDHAFLLDVASGTRRPVRLPQLDGISLPTEPWSPDGRRLLLEQYVSDSSRPVAYTVATGKAVPLDVPDYADPGWSGDGRSVIFSDGSSVYTASARDGRRSVLAKFAHLEPAEPQSSADGRWISFTASDGRRLVYDVARANGTQLHTVPGAVSGTWSPSGERLAFAGFKGAGTLDLATGTRAFVSAPFDSPQGEAPTWSPGGTQVLFERSDLADAPDYEHVQLWAMRADGSGAHPLTHAFPPDAGEWNGPTWVAASLTGKPVPRAQLVALRPTRTLTIDRPVVALSANGERAAIAEGFGFSEYPGPIQPKSGGPLGPIGLWNEATGATTHVAVHGCRHVPTVLLAVRLAYVCDNSEYEVQKQSLRVGSTTVTRTAGDQGVGISFGGTETDGRRVVFGVEDVPLRGRVLSPRLLIEAATASGSRFLWSVAGYGQVLAVDGGGIAYLHGVHQNILTVRSGSSERRIRFARQGVSAAALEGSELVVLESGNRLSVWDPENGRVASWPTAAGDIGSLAVGGAGAELAAYSTGVGIHVMRLSDGREIVLNLGPDATGATLADFGSGGLFYAYNEAYATHPGHVGFISLNALEHAISAKGRKAG